MKMTHKFFALPVLMGALLIAGTTQNAHADTLGEDSEVSLNVAPVADLTVTPTVSLSPSPADYRQTYVEDTDLIEINVLSNTAYTVSVKADAAGDLESADITLKETSGSEVNLGTAETNPVALFNHSSASTSEGRVHTVGVKVNLVGAANALKYVPNASTDKIYKNTLTFSVVAGS